MTALGDFFARVRIQLFFSFIFDQEDERRDLPQGEYFSAPWLLLQASPFPPSITR